MNLDLKKLREVAEAATPGPWVNGVDTVYYEGCVTLATSRVGTDPKFFRKDAAYIAALNPQTALALLDRLEALEHGKQLTIELLSWGSYCGCDSDENCEWCDKAKEIGNHYIGMDWEQDD